LEGFSSNLECVYSWLNETKIREFIWVKDGRRLDDPQELDAELTLRGRFLYFRNLSHLIHNGIYRCEIELVTGQLIKSLNSVNVQILCN
jgi:hypothetical protein